MVRIWLMALASVLLVSGCARVPRITFQNGLGESVIAHVSMPHPGKLRVAAHYSEAFDKTLRPGEVWRSSRAKRSEGAIGDRSITSGVLMIRLQTWGGEPRVYVVRTRKDAVVRIAPDAEEHYRVIASDPDGAPICVVQSDPRE